MTVTVYTADHCPACLATCKWLEKRGIPYTVGTVTSDAARALIERHHFRAAPIVEAGQAAWSGFRPDLIDRLNLTEKGDICP